MAQQFFGYIPPKNFSFENMREAIGSLIAALTSLECARFMQYINTHSGSKNSDLAKFLPAYTLADWSRGDIDPRAWSGRESGAKESLQRWAYSMIEINTFFRKYQIHNPIKYLEEKGFIRRSQDHYGWDPVAEKVAEFLGVPIEMVNPPAGTEKKRLGG